MTLSVLCSAGRMVLGLPVTVAVASALVACDPRAALSQGRRCRASAASVSVEHRSSASVSRRSWRPESGKRWDA